MSIADEQEEMFSSQPEYFLFFDIDNCLYPKSAKVHIKTRQLVDQFITTHCQLSPEEASKLHQEYMIQHGHALSGLVPFHKVDPREFNAQVDDALPLDSMIGPDPELRHLLQDVDTSKVKLWLFTNAYITHARRVVKILGVDDLFAGISYCDYMNPPIICKPHPEAYAKAMREAGAEDPSKCIFVDDSYHNCKGAEEVGWMACHLLDEDDEVPETPAATYQIRDLLHLRNVLPHLFKQNPAASDGN